MRKILISAPYFQPVIERFRDEFTRREFDLVIPTVKERLNEEELLNLLSNVVGVICGDDAFTEKVLTNAKNLKVISKWGTGIDSIDQAACAKLGIKVCNTPNAFTAPVSDTVVAYALNFCRNISQMTEDMRKGIWNKIPGHTLEEATFGIVGFGNIGTAVARKLRPFGCKILVTDRKKLDAKILSESQVENRDLESLLRESDFVSLNCDLNSTSRHLMTIDRFKMMKRSSFIINTARGPIIKETDLLEALKSGLIAGAGLDVFEHEPLSKESELRKFPQVFMAPHNSNSSPKYWEFIHKSTMTNLFNALSN